MSGIELESKHLKTWWKLLIVSNNITRTFIQGWWITCIHSHHTWAGPGFWVLVFQLSKGRNFFWQLKLRVEGREAGHELGPIVGLLTQFCEMSCRVVWVAVFFHLVEYTWCIYYIYPVFFKNNWYLMNTNLHIRVAIQVACWLLPQCN
jgi:hypothetical protein